MGIDDDASAPIGVRPLAPDFLQGGGEMGALMRGHVLVPGNCEQ